MKFSRFISMLVAVVLMGIGVAVSINAPQSQAAFGTSPPWVRNDHLLPGTTFEQIINLSRNESDLEMKVNIRMDGDKEVLKWMKIEDQKDLMMKKGVTVLPMKVTVKVPKNAALKNYRGGIFVTLESVNNEDSAKGGNVAIKLGAHILVDLSVIGDKIVNYRIKSITLDTLSQGEPFHMNVEVENLGNTEITDLNGQIDIYDKKETAVLKSVTFGKLTESVLPDEIKKAPIAIPDLLLEPGEYWIVAKIIKDEKVIYENKLYQKVENKVVPVITPEDVGVKKPGIPKLQEEKIAEEPVVQQTPQVQQPIVIHDAAPAQNNSTMMIFVILGASMGLMAMVVIIVLLVVLIRNQRQAAIQRYLSDHIYHNNEK